MQNVQNVPFSFFNQLLSLTLVSGNICFVAQCPISSCTRPECSGIIRVFRCDLCVICAHKSRKPNDALWLWQASHAGQSLPLMVTGNVVLGSVICLFYANKSFGVDRDRTGPCRTALYLSPFSMPNWTLRRKVGWDVDRVALVKADAGGSSKTLKVWDALS